MKKRLLSILMVLMMVFSLVACGSGTGGDANSDEGNNKAASDETVYVTEPITIEFWHGFGSGKFAQYINDAVARFNETNEYGITVNSTYIGDYVTIRTQLTTSIGAKNNPQVTVLGMSDILASAGVLADMKAYAERDNVDLDAIYENVRTSMYYDGQLTAMPFLRSCTLYYYNKDMFSAAGYDSAPTSIEEMEKACKAVADKFGVYGYATEISPSFGQLALLESLGAEGLIDEDREGVSNLEDGTMLKVLADWRKWIDEGWCWAPTVTNAQNTMYQMIYTGELASCVASSAALTTITEYAKDANVNIGVAAIPTYDGVGGIGGGGDISIINVNNTDQEIAASWEFVKFLMSDEEVATRSEATGYLPTSDGAAALMKDCFAENPNMEAAYKARMKCQDPAGCIELSEWQTQVTVAMSYVIQDKSMTAKEAIEYLKSMLQTVFY